jgi:hypothetical protein
MGPEVHPFVSGRLGRGVLEDEDNELGAREKQKEPAPAACRAPPGVSLATLLERRISLE